MEKGNVESEFSAISMAIPLLRRSECCLGSAAGLNNLLGDRFLAGGLGKQDSDSVLNEQALQTGPGLGNNRG